MNIFLSLFSFLFLWVLFIVCGKLFFPSFHRLRHRLKTDFQCEITAMWLKLMINILTIFHLSEDFGNLIHRHELLKLNFESFSRSLRWMKFPFFLFLNLFCVIKGYVCECGGVEVRIGWKMESLSKLQWKFVLFRLFPRRTHQKNRKRKKGKIPKLLIFDSLVWLNTQKISQRRRFSSHITIACRLRHDSRFRV